MKRSFLSSPLSLSLLRSLRVYLEAEGVNQRRGNEAEEGQLTRTGYRRRHDEEAEDRRRYEKV